MGDAAAGPRPSVRRRLGGGARAFARGDGPDARRRWTRVDGFDAAVLARAERVLRGRSAPDPHPASSLAHAALRPERAVVVRIPGAAPIPGTARSRVAGRLRRAFDARARPRRDGRLRLRARAGGTRGELAVHPRRIATAQSRAGG